MDEKRIPADVKAAIHVMARAGMRPVAIGAVIRESGNPISVASLYRLCAGARAEG